MVGIFEYFKLLRKSKIPFLIVYCPRFYERNSEYFNPISKMYIEDIKNKEEMNTNSIIIDNNLLKFKSKEQDEKIKEQNEKIKKQDEKIISLENQLNTLIKKNKEEDNQSSLLGKKKEEKILVKT